MNRLLSFASIQAIAVSLALFASAARAEEPAQGKEAATASVMSGAKAPSAAYVIEENQESRVAKREVPGGWREVDVKGTVYWCQNSKAFGTRVRKEARCLTPTQYDQLEQDSQRTAEEASRNAAPPRGS